MVTNVFVGGMVGIERTVLPLIAEADFGIVSAAAGTAFIVTFGVTKALVNLFAGGFADRWGRRRLLIIGWMFAFPVPLLLMYAPTWSWVLLANVLLGVNQSLTWSMTVVMKVDLATPSTYGRVIGWNEFAGYAGMAITAMGTGVIASTFGLRPEPFYVGLVVAAVGLLLSLRTRETGPGHAPRRPASRRGTDRSALGVLREGSFGDPALSLASMSGLVTNLKDGALWGLLPILLASRAFSIEGIGLVVALYPAVWALTQLYFGPLSDRVGRTSLISGGLVVQGLGVLCFAAGSSYFSALLGALLAGTGTGMVYPTLLAFVSERSGSQRRASALGVYRFWRDSGYALGALGAGVLADALGPTYALGVVALLLTVVAGAFHARVGGEP